MVKNISERRTPGRASSTALAALTALVALSSGGASLLAAPAEAAPAEAAPAEAAAGVRPIYAIAHRVDTLDGVSAALKHGANAIEIDACAWWKPDVWHAYHDCVGDTPQGPTLDSMFDRILTEAKAGRKLALVWLDIKDPNYCSPKDNRDCSAAVLHDKAQKLTALGIQVLYGFYEYHGGKNPDVGGRGWKSLVPQLGPLEGFTTTGTFPEVQKAYALNGNGLRKLQEVMDQGNTDIGKNFGNCEKKSGSFCGDLMLGAESRDAGGLAATLSWTTTDSDRDYVDKLFGTARVDGIIAGYGQSTGVRDYDDSAHCANAIRLITDWVKQHSSTHRMATSTDKMFH